MKDLANKSFDSTLQSKELYVGLCLFSWLFLGLLSTGIIYLLRPGLTQLGPYLFYIVAGGTLIITVIILGLILIAMAAAYTSLTWPFSFLKIACSTTYHMLPYCMQAGNLLGYSKERIAQSLIDLINMISKRYIYSVLPNEVMLLTPHCLQLDLCPIKVTRDAFLCKQCGRCCVGGLTALAQKYGTMLYIATGGTFARLLVKKYKPKVIIAIACERDLVLGMRDVFPVLVFGVLNDRPYGPCFNTQVDLTKVEDAIQYVLFGGRKENDVERIGI